MSKNLPTDNALYEKVKNGIFSKNPINSAYRSGALVKEYKKKFIEKHGSRKKAYKGVIKTEGLTRWFKEDWRNQRGETGYTKKGDIYRPTKIVSIKTPKTFNELSKSEIVKAMKKKKTVGKVDKF
jgi:hypothetical protein